MNIFSKKISLFLFLVPIILANNGELFGVTQEDSDTLQGIVTSDDGGLSQTRCMKKKNKSSSKTTKVVLCVGVVAVCAWGLYTWCNSAQRIAGPLLHIQPTGGMHWNHREQDQARQIFSNALQNNNNIMDAITAVRRAYPNMGFNINVEYLHRSAGGNAPAVVGFRNMPPFNRVHA